MKDQLSTLRDTVSRVMVPVLWCHIPLAAGIGWLSGNNWLLLGAIAAAIAGVATVAWMRAPSNLSTRLTIAVALIGMVSIILAACRGSPLQIDVHMYYFASLAVLAAYCDRNVILIAATVIAVQHITLNFLVPALVFPGGADFPRVLLHAGILVVEAAALVWLTQRIVQLFRISEQHLAEAYAASKVAAELAEKAEVERAAIDAERRRTEVTREAAAELQQFVVTSVAAGLEKLASCDLLVRLTVPFSAEYEKLREDFNKAMDKLQKTMQSISANTQGVSSGAGEITQASDDLSRRTEQQAASLEQTAAALDQITATVGKTAEGAAEAQKLVAQCKADAETSSGVIDDTVGAMNGIEKSSREIGTIIGVIDEIAFQTNLLALNAGIEAARAGDAGRGFAVVATEVRALAQRATSAAKDINKLVAASGREVENGVRLVGATGDALGRIVGQVARLASLVSEIAASAKEQANGLSEVNTAVNQMDQVTQQNAAMVEQSTAASHSLASEASELAKLVGEFQIGKGEQITLAKILPKGPINQPAVKPRRPVLVSANGTAPIEEGWNEF